MDKVVIVIPALNEEGTIEAVIREAKKVAAVLVVSDGSTDSTAIVAAAAGAQVMELVSNVGVDQALAAGFEEASRLNFDVVATIDADGQHDASALEKIISPVTSGTVDMCHSIRDNYGRPTEWLLRKYSSYMHGLHDVLSGLKSFRIATVYEPHAEMASRPTLGTALPWAAVDDGLSIAEIVITVRGRERGDTPRIGGNVKANYRVIKALFRLMWWDLRSIIRAPRRFYTNRFRLRDARRVRLA